jgi:xylulokinase
VVDAGTTAVKAALLGPGGATLATVSVEQPVQHPGPGRVEQRPDHWWLAFLLPELVDGSARSAS